MAPTMRGWIGLCCLATAACGVQLEERVGGAAPGPLPGVDASIDAEPDATPQPRCSNGRVVYLNFDGVTLTRAATSDATQNLAGWMTIAQGTAPRYRSGASDRLQQIQAITDGVRQQLSSFPVTVVTQRPASGPYVMIVYGGVASQVGSSYGGAVMKLDCTDAQKSDLAWVSDNVGPTQRVVNYSIGAIGFGLGLTATNDPVDCMCGWANGCQQDQTGPCKLSTMINRDQNANQTCPGLITQNEEAAFDAAFCR